MSPMSAKKTPKKKVVLDTETVRERECESEGARDRGRD